MAKTMEQILMESLKQKAILLNGGILLAKGRTKAEKTCFDEVLTLNNFEFSKSTIDGKESEFVAYTVKEDENQFFFGGSVVTENLKKFNEEETALILKVGIPVKFELIKTKIKGHNDYTKIVFFPEDLV
jgi:hypothetical protein